jgi:phosphohistidine phosphatase
VTGRLVILRHAKAETFALTDHGRELTVRGRRDAHAVGGYLRERGIVPDHAVVSSSVRTRETWDAIEAVVGSGADVVADDAVYSGSTDVVLEALRAVPADANTVAFVGHQPTVGHVAHLLDDGVGDDEALHRMLHGFPSASLALFDVEVPWVGLDEQTGRLVDFRPGGS